MGRARRGRSHRPPPPRRTKTARSGGRPVSPGELAFVASMGAIFTAIWAVEVGQDVNWDQRNYHVYTVFSWLAGREHLDLAPAQLQTWLNPLLQLPNYVAVMFLPPVWAGALIGAAAGLSLPLVYLIADRLWPDGAVRWRRLGAWAAALLGVTGPAFLSEVGTTFIDNQTALLVLAALAIALHSDEAEERPRALLAAAICGLCLGVVVGGKLTNGVFALPMLLLVPVALYPRWMVARTACLWAGALAGFLIAAGAWMASLWRLYGNPFFPFFNAVFRSPWLEAVNLEAVRWTPSSPLDALSYPIKWLVGIANTSELPFRDSRFALVLLALVIAAVAVPLRARGRVAGLRALAGAVAADPARRRQWFFAAFFLASFALWISAFGIQRYLIALELLAGVMLALLLASFVPSPRVLALLLVAAAAFSIVWSRPIDWWRRPYSHSWFGVEVPVELHESGTLFVMHGGGHPYGYIVPFFPRDARFVRITGNFALQPDRGLGRVAAQRIAAHRGPLRTVAPVSVDQEPASLAALAAFGLEIDPSDCVAFVSHVDRFSSCRLRRSAP